MARRVMTMLFYTKAQCSLCVVAKQNIAGANRVLNDGIKVQEVDIEAAGNEAFFKEYRFYIPVGTVKDREVFRHRLSDERAVEIYREWERAHGQFTGDREDG